MLHQSMLYSAYVALVVTLNPPFTGPVVDILGVYSTRELCEGQIARLPVSQGKVYRCYGVYKALPETDPLLAPLHGDFPAKPSKS